MTETRARWFVRGDLDGFFGLALDNLIQLLVIVALCSSVLGFSADLLYGTVLPAVGVSLIVGNLFYAWQGMQLARREGRDDVCALPYGINTITIFVYVFLVMLPVKLDVLSATDDPAAAERAAWQAGVVACLGSGLIEFVGAFVVDRVREHVPRAALLSTLAGIAVTFIAMDFVYRTYAAPVVGLATLAVVLLVYFGGVRFKGGVPGGAVAVLLGTALCWATGVAGGPAPEGTVGLRLPVPVVGDLFDGLEYLRPYASVIFAMGVFNLFGSLQNLDNAAAAGDRFETRPSLAANGLGTLAAALFGSCFPTTIYIGHPGWKGLGARLGYSWLNGVVMTAVCMTGTVALIAWAVPIEAGMAIVLWIAVVIAAQAFQATPRRHAPAVVFGLIPGIATWGVVMLKQGARAAGGTVDEGLGDALTALDVHPEGMFALEQGGIFTAMLLAAVVVEVVERRFRRAALWSFCAAALSWIGLMHGWRWTGADTAMELGLGAGSAAALGYAAMGLLFLAVPLIGHVRPAESS